MHRWITRASLIVGAAALIWTLHDVGLRALAEHFKLIGAFWIAVVALEAAITTLDACAIRAFAGVSLRTALHAQLAGRAVNALTPTGNLGEPVKVSVLAHELPTSRAASTIVVYNVIGFVVELWQVALAAPLVALLVPSLRHLLFGAGAVALVAGIAIYLVAGRRAQWTGIAAIAASRALSLCVSLVLLHAMGMPLTLGFVAVYVVGGLPIHLLSALTPMGLGIAETSYYGLFRALGYDPTLGVMLVVARRCVLIGYAVIGLVLGVATAQCARSSCSSP